MSGDKVYPLLDDQGDLLGMVSLAAINARGEALAHDLAAVSSKPRQIEAIVGQLLADVGPREAGYVAASALGVVVQDILDPLIEVAEALGHPIRARLAEVARAARDGRS